MFILFITEPLGGHCDGKKKSINQKKVEMGEKWFCVFLQKYCVPLRNFVFPPISYYFHYKSVVSECKVPFQSVTPSHVGWPTKLGSRQRDQSTSSVTKRANGHWHAIIASSCRWSPCEYKRQQVHRINSSFRFGAERWCITTALYFGVAERTRVRALRQQQRWSRSRGYQVRADKHTRSVRWPAPLRASALKEQIL